MTGEKFAEIVTKRAHERVNAKIKVFKAAVTNALRELTGDKWLTKEPALGGVREANNRIFEQIVEKKNIEFKKGWPGRLWEQEEELVSKELLSMMDEMQKALIAPGPSEDDATPAD